MKNKTRPKIVCLGGGTGTYQVLLGLKKYPVDLTAIISMADDGGSNRILRDEFGILPTSDIRQALVALADDDGEREILRKLFTYRYRQGVGISGMTFGNLFMAALADIFGSQLKAIEETENILHTQGKILPMTLDNVKLVAKYKNGYEVVGEHEIDEPNHDGTIPIVSLRTIPKAKIYPLAKKAILDADVVILGPGDLYTSTIVNLVIDGTVQAIKKTKAKVIYVMNLMTKYGQTWNYKASNYLKDLEKYLGKGVVDVILINNNINFPKSAIKLYDKEKAVPVENDIISGNHLQVVSTDLVSSMLFKKAAADILVRSVFRHDPDKLAKTILKVIK